MQEPRRQAPSRLRTRLVPNVPDARGRGGRLPLKVYGVMAMTTALTFATLTTGYQLLFTHQLFA